MPGREYLFVYGTLRQGFRHPLAVHLTQHAELVGKGRFQGQMYDLGSYPGVVPSERASDMVVGDVYALRRPQVLFRLLDKYEGYYPNQPARSLYLRQKRPISLERGETRRAWIYLYNASVAPFKRIKSGDYLRYIRQKNP